MNQTIKEEEREFKRQRKPSARFRRELAIQPHLLIHQTNSWLRLCELEVARILMRLPKDSPMISQSAVIVGVCEVTGGWKSVTFDQSRQLVAELQRRWHHRRLCRVPLASARSR